MTSAALIGDNLLIRVVERRVYSCAQSCGGYNTFAKRSRYTFRRVQHSQRIYVSGDVHTNTVEGFFGHFKTDVRGTHHSVSRRWLGSYLNEWVWKWNHRDDDRAMFHRLLDRAALAG